MIGGCIYRGDGVPALGGLGVLRTAMRSSRRPASGGIPYWMLTPSLWWLYWTCQRLDPSRNLANEVTSGDSLAAVLQQVSQSISAEFGLT